MTPVDRRGFLKLAGFGSLASAALLDTIGSPEPAAADGLDAQAAARPVIFDISTNASAGIFQGHKFSALITGEGRVSGRSVEGGGRFVIFDQLLKIPRPVDTMGTWQPRRLLSAQIVGTYGGLAAGAVDLEVLLAVKGQRRPVLGRLKIVANLPVAQLFTTVKGGVTLALPGTAFDTGGGAGPFVTSARRAQGFSLRV